MDFETKYDFAIIGSGISGLICGAWLARKGHSTIVLEKNHQIGGALQVFSRDKRIFDTGVHYLGGLEEGGALNRLFHLLGIGDHIKHQLLDVDCFDKICFADGSTYNLAQTWRGFTDSLCAYFPEECDGICRLVQDIHEMVNRFGPYHLEPLKAGALDASILSVSARDKIDQYISNPRLKAVLFGNSLLFAGNRHTTPFYVYALILNSYVNGSSRLIRGGSQIAKYLTTVIHEAGGKVVKHAEVTGIDVQNQKVTGVNLMDGRHIACDQVIGAIHPSELVRLLPKDVLRSSYTERIKTLINTTAFTSIFYTIKENSLPYFNYNYYLLNDDDSPWRVVNKMHDEHWPDNIMISTSRETIDQTHCHTISVLTYGHIDDFNNWTRTANTIVQPQQRGSDYERLKNTIIERLTDQVSKVIPNLKNNIANAYCATPLTYRDYLHAPQGTGYGIEKNYSDILYTFVSPKMKISNLYLTGQSTDLHGVYGAAISALLTLSHTKEGASIFDEIVRDKK